MYDYAIILNPLHSSCRPFNSLLRKPRHQSAQGDSQSSALQQRKSQGKLMDVELQNKYKVSPTEVQNIQAKRQRPDSEGGKGDTQDDGPQWDNHANSGANKGSQRGNRGRGAGRGRGKGGEGKGEDEEGEKGSKGGKGAKRGGKGKGKGGYSTEQMLSTSGKLLARLCRDRRDNIRCTQFILRIPSDHSLFSALANAQRVWKETRPTTGRHPDGEMHELLWRLTVDNLYASLQSAECVSAEQKGHIKELNYFLKLTVHNPADPLTPGLRPTSVRRFQPAGRQGRPPPEEGKDWVWVLSTVRL
jgi:hypothetical protein